MSLLRGTSGHRPHHPGQWWLLPAAGLHAPAGSIVHASPPAAVAAGNVETSQRIADVLLGALAQAAPARVPAASQGTMNNVLVGNDDFAYYETVAGGQGARPGRDGQSGIQTGMTNTQNTPIEALHRHYPFRVTAYTLRRGSGGAGASAAAMASAGRSRFEVPATLSLMGERRRHAPWGWPAANPGPRVRTGWSGPAVRRSDCRARSPSRSNQETGWSYSRPVAVAGVHRADGTRARPVTAARPSTTGSAEWAVVVTD